MYLYSHFSKNLPEEETNDQKETLINKETENPENSVPEILQVII